MAKITDIKFEIKGVKHAVHVNCNSSGLFSANLPSEVAKALNLNSKLEFVILDDLEKEFNEAIERYKKAETKQELFILIRYAANGRFSEKVDGLPLFGGYRNEYHLDVSGIHSDNMSALGFEFHVCIKETIDCAENWYHTKQGKEFTFPDETEYRKQPDKYFKEKQDKISHPERWKIIPFSEQAVINLKNIEEKIRSASEILHNFITQDIKVIESSLNGLKALL